MDAIITAFTEHYQDLSERPDWLAPVIDPDQKPSARPPAIIAKATVFESYKPPIPKTGECETGVEKP